jgi:hypothetical protein
MAGGRIALADQGGATVNQTTCFPFYNNGQVCVATVGELTDTVTPSRLESYQFTGTQDITFYDANHTIFASQTQRSNVHILFQNGGVWEEGNHVTYTQPLATVICTGSFDIHYVNGAFQYNNSAYTCS